MNRMILTNVERGGLRTAYSANIEVDGRTVGYVQKVKGGEYRAYMDGVCIGSATTVTELRADIREHLADQYSDARESW